MSRVKAIIDGLREWSAESSNTGVITKLMAREMAVCILRQPAFGSADRKDPLTDSVPHELKPALGDGAPAEQQKPISVAQADQAVPVGDAEASQVFDGHPPKGQAELIRTGAHPSIVTDYAVALVAADCSALICEHTTRLGLDPFAAAAVARAVQARIMEMTNVR